MITKFAMFEKLLNPIDEIFQNVNNYMFFNNCRLVLFCLALFYVK